MGVETWDVRAGVYRHYKGPLYLVMGLAHDANAPTLTCSEVHAQHDVYHPDGHPTERTVVLYIGLELNEAHTGPRLAVRTYEDFFAQVCGTEACPLFGEPFQADPYNGCLRCRNAPVTRFTYIGPTWEGQR